jgi:4-amino-4-deoxy-L-arabinose transferase-like glycosyltransferase
VNERMKKSHRVDSSVPFPWLTVEITLWGLLLFIALGLRLYRLEAAPLNATEARGALAAWRFVHGQDLGVSGFGGAQSSPQPNGVLAATDYSPVLFSAQWFTFLVFGGSDLAARLLPALAGAALALAPALLRQQLGRLGALMAGTLLALSPTALTLSRTASGDVLVALGVLLFAGGLWRYTANQRTGESASTQYAALGIALVLVSSPLAYSALLSLGSALLLLILADRESRDQLQRGWIAFRAGHNLTTRALGVLVGGFVLLSTAFGWHIGGLAAAADLLTEWLGGFIHWPDSLSLGYPILILLIYEPLILLLGGVGGILAMIRVNAPSRFLALWSVVALTLALIRPGHGPGDVLLVLLPLACLGGLTLNALIEGLRRWGHWLNEGPYLAISVPLWAYLAINLATYSSRPGQYTGINLLFVNVSLPTYLGLALASIFSLLMVAGVLGLIQGPGPMLRGLGLSTTMALLLFTIASTWGVSQNRPSDPRELLVLEPTAPEVRLLRESLARLSHEHRRGAYAIDLTVLTDDPALAWVLRDFRQAHFATPEGLFAYTTETPSFTSAIIAPQTSVAPQLGEGYVGQSFPLRRRWGTEGLTCRWNLAQLGFDQVRQLDCGALVQWLIFRRSPGRPTEERVVLWLRRDLAGW